MAGLDTRDGLFSVRQEIHFYILFKYITGLMDPCLTLGHQLLVSHHRGLSSVQGRSKLDLW
jgi:hypothetical protein